MSSNLYPKEQLALPSSRDIFLSHRSLDKNFVQELLQDEDDRKIIMSLLNMAITRHANKVGLVIDETKNGRFFFPPKNGEPNSITWIPKKSKASRTVAKPWVKNGQVLFWRHLGAYLRMLFLAKNFYLKITPTWVFTEDGYQVKGGPTVGKLAIRWTGAERNMQVLYHVRFWTTVLRTGGGPISIKAGDQRIEISTIPAFVQQVYGIAGDQKDLLGLLDQEAPLIAQAGSQLLVRAGLRWIDVLGRPEVLGNRPQGARPNNHGVGNGSQQAHHQLIVSIEPTDVPPARMTRFIQRHDSIEGGDKVANDVRLARVRWQLETPVEDREVRWQRQGTAPFHLEE